MSMHKQTKTNSNHCVVIIRDRGKDPALDEMWKGLRSLANAYLFRLRNVKSKRSKSNRQDSAPSIPAPSTVSTAPPVATLSTRMPSPAPRGVAEPVLVVPPAPVKAKPASYVEVVLSPPKKVVQTRQQPVVLLGPKPAAPKPLGASAPGPLSSSPSRHGPPDPIKLEVVVWDVDSRSSPFNNRIKGCCKGCRERSEFLLRQYHYFWRGRSDCPPTSVRVLDPDVGFCSSCLDVMWRDVLSGLKEKVQGVCCWKVVNWIELPPVKPSYVMTQSYVKK